jgi:hypothetical protein
MNAGLILVARELMRDAAQLYRWSQMNCTPVDIENADARLAGARLKARAAFRLIASTKEHAS